MTGTNIERAGIQCHWECRTVTGEGNVFSHCNLILHQTLKKNGSLFMWYTHKANYKILEEDFTPSWLHDSWDEWLCPNIGYHDNIWTLSGLFSSHQSVWSAHAIEPSTGLLFIFLLVFPRGLLHVSSYIKYECVNTSYWIHHCQTGDGEGVFYNVSKLHYGLAWKHFA